MPFPRVMIVTTPCVQSIFVLQIATKLGAAQPLVVVDDDYNAMQMKRRICERGPEEFSPEVYHPAPASSSSHRHRERRWTGFPLTE